MKRRELDCVIYWIGWFLWSLNFKFFNDIYVLFIFNICVFFVNYECLDENLVFNEICWEKIRFIEWIKLCIESN